MAKKQFKTESKRLLDLMIHSIYTHKEIFLRELISNASDAIDKIYYKALTDENITFRKEDYYIKITADKEKRTLTIEDTGIGMTKAELEDNLGVIAKSGSLDFKQANEAEEDYNIIGQFGVGFYSAFMVSKKVTVVTKALDSDEAYKWESKGADGYTVVPAEKESVGTQIVLEMKDNTEEENYDEFLEEYRLQALIKKYSDFIRYPIKMDIQTSVQKEGTEGEYEELTQEQVVNSMVPIWRKNKNELSDEDYINFYHEKHYGFDNPMKHIHISVDGAVRYNAILYIPEKTPFDFYTKEYQKGLELYSNGVLIMNKCADLLPDYFSFVQGMVDSEDLSLNISRELLQHDRQLRLIAKNIKNKIKSELLNLLKEEREKYETFYKAFGRHLKYGLYADYGMNREELEELLLFYSSHEKKMVTLDEYVSRMKEEQKYIYYAAGETIERIEQLPQTEAVIEKGYELLYFTEDVDEFAIRMLMKYKDKEFKSVSEGDLGIEGQENGDQDVPINAEEEEMLKYMTEILKDKIKDVIVSKRLKRHPVCLSTQGGVSIEMEKVLSAMPGEQKITAQKVLEINRDSALYAVLQDAYANDKEKLRDYTELLYNQALLIEGLPIEDPLKFSTDICKLMK